jgi:hypothetical protein
MSDTPTPRTQAARCNVDTYADQYLFSHSTDGEWVRYEVTEQLERELAEVTKQRDALAIAMKCIERHGVIMGSTGDYRQGQLDALKSVKVIASETLAATKGGSHE